MRGRYTVDAVAMLRWLVDVVPDEPDAVFKDAENGEAIVQAPTVTLAESCTGSRASTG